MFRLKMHARDRGVKRLLFVLWLAAGGFVYAQQAAPTVTAVVKAGGLGEIPITAGSIVSIWGTGLAVNEPPGGLTGVNPKSETES